MITLKDRKSSLERLHNEVNEIKVANPIDETVLHRLKLALIRARVGIDFFDSDQFQFNIGQVMAHLEYLGNKELWVLADFIRAGE